MELKLPPPVVALLLGILMWSVAMLVPAAQLQLGGLNQAALTLLLAGVGTSVSGMLAFRTAQTTVDPRYPDKATTLVRAGVYRFTRNPMYLGLLLVLGAAAVYLANPLNLLGLPLFVWYITRFQIRPEEEALHRLFGAAYIAYCARVRRWI